jgi:hypothetical protein
MKLVDFSKISNNDYLVDHPLYPAVETYLSGTNSNNVTSDILGS